MIAFLDLPSGISGDMFLGCLVDAGWDVDALRDVPRRLGLADECDLSASEVMKGPLRATRVDVRVEETSGRVDRLPDASSTELEPVSGNNGATVVRLSRRITSPPKRGLRDVRELIASSSLSETVKRRAVAVFERLARAEARVHGTSVDEVHFHEVGAVDAIVDIVGVVAGLAALGIERLYAGPVPLGEGWATTAHGELPTPAPATLELLAAAGAPTRPAPGPGELVTPTGAALVAELATFARPPMRLRRVATGAGGRDCAWPNVARLLLGDPLEELPASPADGGGMIQLDTNLDDMNPQFYPSVTERLLAAGAADVWLTPIQMKKGRPAVTISVLAKAADEARLADVLLRETTTLGVRVHRFAHRHAARRELRSVETPFGSVRTKLKWLGAEPVAAVPEYEDCRTLADAGGHPVRAVHEAAVVASQALLASLRAAAAPS